jgi:hypothetical protein
MSELRRDRPCPLGNEIEEKINSFGSEIEHFRQD